MAGFPNRLGGGLYNYGNASGVGVAFTRTSAAAAVTMREMPHDVFYHHYRAVHNHSEIQRPQREEIGGNLAQIEPNRSEHQGERYGYGHDQGGANIAHE